MLKNFLITTATFATISFGFCAAIGFSYAATTAPVDEATASTNGNDSKDYGTPPPNFAPNKTGCFEREVMYRGKKMNETLCRVPM